MAAPYEFHLNRNTSELLRNITQETRHVVSDVLTQILKLAMDTVFIFGIFGMLFWVNPLITLLVFVLLGGVLAFFF